MLRHSLARAMSCWKSIKATLAVLLAVVVTIPIVHVAAAVLHNVAYSNHPKSRLTDVDATPARARRAHRAFVTQNKRDLSRRQWRVGGDLASSDSLYSSPPTSESRELPTKDRQGSAASHRTYRTVCVRLCDGYFFPISFAVPREYLVRDARRCQASCGAQARLFYHSDVNAGIADMTDLEGRPYSNLEAAFLYRAAYFPTCKCQPHPWEKEATERHRMYALASAANKGDKAAAVELSALQSALNQGEDREVQQAPTARPPAINRPTRAKSATTSSEKPNAPTAADWSEKAFQSRY
jgi:Protein of unknown function (DUF2865)